MADPIDRSRMAAAREGDERSFTQLVKPYRRELHRHCYRMLGSVDDADDKDALDLVGRRG